MTNPLKVNAYMKAIPPGNKNPEKPKLLEYFIEGVSKAGDKGQIINTFQYEPADVGILPLATFFPTALINPLESMIKPPISSKSFFGSIIFD